VPTGSSTYSADGGETGDIYVISVDGSGLVNLTSDAANDWAPAWSSR
jgi:Tol biopolymer transport system component